jgi:hypothetical protein
VLQLVLLEDAACQPGTLHYRQWRLPAARRCSRSCSSPGLSSSTSQHSSVGSYTYSATYCSILTIPCKYPTTNQLLGSFNGRIHN